MNMKRTGVSNLLIHFWLNKRWLLYVGLDWLVCNKEVLLHVVYILCVSNVQKLTISKDFLFWELSLPWCYPLFGYVLRSSGVSQKSGAFWYWFRDTARKRNAFITLEPLVWFRWGFQNWSCHFRLDFLRSHHVFTFL